VIYFVLPFVDASSVRCAVPGDALLFLIDRVTSALERNRVELHLETDLSGLELAALMRRVPTPWVKLNYDIGNSASLGHPPGEHLRPCLPWIGSVHVKDRVEHGTTVPLGTGDADFDTTFALLKEAAFDRPYILQVAREKDGDEVAWAMQNRRFVEKWTSS
jgi:hexulose-6-phosphate isomerase